MELVREMAPILLGMLVPPIIMLVLRASWSGQFKFMAAFVPALILGVCTSVLAGELASGMPDALIAVIIDTSLVYTGSQLAYWLFWKPISEKRLQHLASFSMKRMLK